MLPTLVAAGTTTTGSEAHVRSVHLLARRSRWRDRARPGSAAANWAVSLWALPCLGHRHCPVASPTARTHVQPRGSRTCCGEAARFVGGAREVRVAERAERAVRNQRACSPVACEDDPKRLITGVLLLACRASNASRKGSPTARLPRPCNTRRRRNFGPMYFMVPPRSAVASGMRAALSPSRAAPARRAAPPPAACAPLDLQP